VQRDSLPCPITELLANRAQLCDHCFFGGPGKLIASV
jgi:hypothetical protein